jgi:hypothetical protein
MQFVLICFIVCGTTSRKMRGKGHAACMGERRNAYRVLVGEHEGKRPFGRLDMSGRIILNGCYGNGMRGCGMCGLD